MRRWYPRAAALLALTAVGCGASDEGTDSASDVPAVHVDVPAIHTDVYGGTKDDDDNAFSGVVAVRVGLGDTFELCSGSLIAPNVVLTARHCVTQNVTSSVSCDQNGRSANGKHVAGDEDPNTIGIYVGPRPNFGDAPEATAKAIVAPKGDFLCDSDIALVVLASNVRSAKPLSVRLQSPAKEGEFVRAVGYGQNDQGAPIGTRYRRDDVHVLAQGRRVSDSKTPLGSHEFEVGQSICQGDSGGPAISQETHAVIGVVSRGGSCNDDFGHIYTTTAGFDALFGEAFAIAGTSPTLEAKNAKDALSGAPDGDPSADVPRPHSCAMARAPMRSTSEAYGVFGLVVAGVIVAMRRARRRSA